MVGGALILKTQTSHLKAQSQPKTEICVICVICGYYFSADITSAPRFWRLVRPGPRGLVFSR
jgi:hypothetical protein